MNIETARCIESDDRHADSPYEYLDNIKEKILVLLAQHERLEPEQISAILKLGVKFSLFHLEELKKSSLVRDCTSSGEPATWELSQAGRAYLVHHGLL